MTDKMYCKHTSLDVLHTTMVHGRSSSHSLCDGGGGREGDAGKLTKQSCQQIQ